MKKTLLKFTRFPYRKTIDQFDLKAQVDMDERRIRELLNLSFSSYWYGGNLKMDETPFYYNERASIPAKKSRIVGKAREENSFFIKRSVLIIDEIGYLNLLIHKVQTICSKLYQEDMNVAL